MAETLWPETPPKTKASAITGPAAKLGITTAPSSSAQSGVAFAQQPVIQVQDAQGNPVSQNATVITATFASGTGSLTNPTATTNAIGTATFAGLAITGLAGNYTLSFGATGLTSVASGTIVLSSGGATQLLISTEPSASAQNGVALAQQPAVQLQDAGGNPVWTWKACLADILADICACQVIALGSFGGVLDGGRGIVDAMDGMPQAAETFSVKTGSTTQIEDSQTRHRADQVHDDGFFKSPVWAFS